MPFDNLSDYFVMRMYESLRDEVLADATSGVRIVGEPAKARAEELQREIERRGLFCTPIAWPGEAASAQPGTSF
ncbi:hypothetical protein JQ612_17745 [Bradyrhizobium manausense]|uniref:hypothetical protein n=1 Tax=Bradyrhizobium manausense TaxID=989370 RepID=UPI001BA52B64|nr:hypothetical protein [Bradyrhizobium manausense]MBR0691364.1 hypothetical protein [Bradyrhizobium manausense]MBR0725308.1 hypothetical protein [Bradyrhizobium manausense]MBR0835035.1 hypothetical protein [Bradyrhizobium manausense]